MRSILWIFSFILFSFTAVVRGEKDVLSQSQDSISVGSGLESSSSGLEGEKSSESAVMGDLFGATLNSDPLGMVSSSSFGLQDLGDGMDLSGFYNPPEINGTNKKDKAPWAVETYSLFDTLKYTTNPFGDSVRSLNELSENYINLEPENPQTELFTNHKSEPLKIISLWEEDPSKASSSEDSEPLSWGWSLKGPRNPSKPKRGGLFD